MTGDLANCRLKVRSFALALALALALAGAGAPAQEIAPLAHPGAPASAFPKPDRPVAEIISPIWATEKERDAVDEAGQIARLLDLRPGMSIADIGAGSGYHTVRLAKVVGPTGRVLAQDVMPLYLTGLHRRIGKLKLENVTISLGEGHDPRLPPASVDVALLVHMYHEIAQPFAFLHNLVPAMRAGGRLGIVDLVRPTWEHGTPPELLRCELAAVGYTQIAFSELAGEIGYLATFAPPGEADRPAPGAIKPCRMQKP